MPVNVVRFAKSAADRAQWGVIRERRITLAIELEPDHPRLEIAALSANAKAGQTMAQVWPHFAAYPALPKLWRYNLHYFDDLDAENSSARRSWHEALTRRWIHENPPATGAGWEPRAGPPAGTSGGSRWDRR